MTIGIFANAVAVQLNEVSQKFEMKVHKIQDLLENQKKNALLSIQKYDLNTVTNTTIKIYQNLFLKKIFC